MTRRFVRISRISVTWLLALSFVLPFSPAAEAVLTCPSFPWADALHHRVDCELFDFTNWLSAHGVQGYVGEVGWPDNRRMEGSQWNALAELWYSRADASQLWVTQWVASEILWPISTNVVYHSVATKTPITVAESQDAVLQNHLETASYRRGVNLNGLENPFPAGNMEESPFSNRNPGAWTAAHPQSFTFLADHGVKTIRLPFRWERLQPNLFAALNTEAVAKVRRSVDRARNNGMNVILDLHNYGAYYRATNLQTQGHRLQLGSSDLPVAALQDFWDRLSASFQNYPGVIGYDIMNEPHQALNWHAASQAVVCTIRNRGDDTLILVAGSGFSLLEQGWSQTNGAPWITSCNTNIRYEAHHYWGPGPQYSDYASTVQAAQAAGY